MGMQLQNGLGKCLDLMHQHVDGDLIQWNWKDANSYKAGNQLFTCV